MTYQDAIDLTRENGVVDALGVPTLGCILRVGAMTRTSSGVQLKPRDVC